LPQYLFTDAGPNQAFAPAFAIYRTLVHYRIEKMKTTNVRFHDAVHHEKKMNFLDLNVWGENTYFVEDVPFVVRPA
jgi:hypothetical protein